MNIKLTISILLVTHHHKPADHDHDHDHDHDDDHDDDDYYDGYYDYNYDYLRKPPASWRSPPSKTRPPFKAPSNKAPMF